MKTTVFRGALPGALACFAIAAHGTTYQVGPGRTPYTQLTQVANLLNPGDVVELDGNATYNRVTMMRSGTQAQPITIRGMAQGAQRPVINGASAGTNGTALQLDANHYVIEDVVAANASTRCVYMHGNNLTLRRVQVHTCTRHGILGSDADSGDMLLTEVEVFNQGNQAAPSAFDHPIYIATDQLAYPNAVLRIEKSWIHDNYSGNSIKSRAKTVKVFYNWIEATNTQNHTLELIGPDPGGARAFCPVPNGTNDADLCSGEVVGNVLIARGVNANLARFGSDGTGWSNGRYHVVNNTFIANNTFNSESAAMIRAFGPLQSIELHNNIFWLQLGDTQAIRIVRDAEANWVNGRRVTGTKNIVTGSASAYATGTPGAQIQGLTGTIFTTTGAVFANVTGAVLAAGTAIDARLSSGSPARLVGNAGNTSTAGYQIPNPTNLPAMQPPLMRPSPGVFAATARPQPTDSGGNPVNGAIGIGALELGYVSEVAPPQPNYTALWWNSAESGWGLNLTHQGDVLFGTLFTYDAARNPFWLVMPEGRLAGSAYAGPLYRTTGPAFNATPFTPIGAASVTRVGDMRVTFGPQSATVSYDVDAIQVTKSVTRQVFGPLAATCLASASARTSLTNYQDLWWNPAESGWGLNLTHQGNVIFATLFTYGLDGRGAWFVMSAGQRQADGSFTGDLYRTRGSPFNATPFVPLSPADVTRVGTMMLRFADGENGTLDYTIDGGAVRKSITRQVFAAPQAACSG